MSCSSSRISWYAQSSKVSPMARLVAIWIEAQGGKTLYPQATATLGNSISSIELVIDELCSANWVTRSSKEVLSLLSPSQIVTYRFRPKVEDLPGLFKDVIAHVPTVEDLAAEWVSTLSLKPFGLNISINLNTRTQQGRIQRKMWKTRKELEESGKMNTDRMWMFIRGASLSADELSGSRAFSQKTGSWFKRYLEWERARANSPHHLMPLIDKWYECQPGDYQWGPRGLETLIPLLETNASRSGSESVLKKIENSPPGSSPWQVFPQATPAATRLPTDSPTSPATSAVDDSGFLRGFQK